MKEGGLGEAALLATTAQGLTDPTPMTGAELLGDEGLVAVAAVAGVVVVSRSSNVSAWLPTAHRLNTMMTMTSTRHPPLRYRRFLPNSGKVVAWKTKRNSRNRICKLRLPLR